MMVVVIQKLIRISVVSEMVKLADTPRRGGLIQAVKVRTLLSLLMNEDLDWLFEHSEIKVTPYKGAIGDIERLIDDLIGFTPFEIKTEKDYKRAYAERMSLIEMARQQAPDDIIKQLNKLTSLLDRLREAREKEKDIDLSLKEIEKDYPTPSAIKPLKKGLLSVYQKAFVEKTKDLVVMISANGWRMPLDEYLEQESWARLSEHDKELIIDGRKQSQEFEERRGI